MTRTTHQAPLSVHTQRGNGMAAQRGQALIYGIFVLVAALAGLFFLFNAGQLVREKTKLVNTADAVAYSAGVMNARALNFQAYGNRAMVANSVSFGQLVSLSSWTTYAQNLGTFGGYTALQPQFLPFHPSYYAAASAGPGLQQLGDLSLETLARVSDGIVHNLLVKSQEAAYSGLVSGRAVLMNEVAAANYTGDGRVVVDAASLLGVDMGDFVKQYSGDERTRFKEVVETAINKDPFVPSRSWSMSALVPTCLLNFDRLRRKGGTELLGLDEWRAMDTLSAWQWRPGRFFGCRRGENPTGWGGRSAGEDSGDGGTGYYDGAPSENPGAAALATLSSTAWNYRGLPAFHDLSDSAMKAADPRLQLAIRVRRERTETLSSEGRSAIRGGSRLNNYQAALGNGDDLVAVSASEAFFERDASHRDNVHGQGRGKPVEVASLFNPFWQVRLIHSPEGLNRAQALKGVSLVAR